MPCLRLFEVKKLLPKAAVSHILADDDTFALMRKNSRKKAFAFIPFFIFLRC
jgi:hypothetical protein